MTICPYTDTHPQCTNGTKCVCGYFVIKPTSPKQIAKANAGKILDWKLQFEDGEVIPLKGIFFRATFTRRGLSLRKVKV